MVELVWIVVLIVSLVTLVKGADWFTLGAESVGLRFGIPQFVIGVTIVSVGTSLPELASSVAAVFEGTTEIVVANIVGSNIANSLLVLGIVAFIGGGIVTKRAVAKIDMPFLFVATCLLVLVAINAVLSRVEAFLFIALFLGYMWWLFTQKREVDLDYEHNWLKSTIYLVVGGVLLIASAKFLIDSVVQVGMVFNINPAFISASIVAFGTSVPEVVVSVVAVLKNKKDLALGNIIGSNLFNILLVGGVAGLISPLLIDQRILVFALPVLFLSTVMLWLFIMRQEITRLQGVGLFIAYLLFISFLFL